MWVLLIVLAWGHGLTSEQMYFSTKKDCLDAQALIEKNFDWKQPLDVRCLCVEAK